MSSFLVTVLASPQLPGQIVSHWNAAGQPDGYAPAWFLYFVPALSAALLVFFQLIPRIDPKQANIRKFRDHDDRFVAGFTGFLLYLQLLAVSWNLGLTFNLLQLLSPGFGALFFLTGVTLGHAKQNGFLGIRTPWTLSSKAVWMRTHRLGAVLFKLAGIICLFGAALSASVAFLLAPALSASLVLMVPTGPSGRRGLYPGGNKTVLDEEFH